MPKRKTSSVDECLGKNLSYYRKIAGYTQQQIADMLNLNRTTYTKYETGASEPGIEILKKIAEILKIDIESLLYDENSRPPVTETKETLKNISTEELNLLSRYRVLARDDREELYKILNSMC